MGSTRVHSEFLHFREQKIEERAGILIFRPVGAEICGG